jgi:flagellar hook assembly protein FlgD
LIRPPAYVVIAVLAAVFLALALPPSPRAQGTGLVTWFDLSESAFSPDGDGAQDSTAVTFTLSEDSPSTAVVVYASDSVTVVDTLLAAGPQTAGDHTVFWSGTDLLGQDVAEGLYLIYLTARGTVANDTALTLPVSVDNTPPNLQILLSEPGIYAPGLLGTPQVYGVTFVVTNSSPTFGLPTLADQLSVKMFDASGAPVTLDTFVTVVPAYSGQNGTYELRWNANKMQPVVDGIYRIDLTLDDQAGHGVSASDHPNVDFAAPSVGFVNVEEGASMRTVPDTLLAWAWDRNGVDSLYVKYADTKPYWFVANTVLVNDTTHFSVPLADSLPGEGSFKISVRAKDAAAADTGRVSTPAIRFSVDATPPPPPALEPFDGQWRTSLFTLRGTWSGSPEVIRIFRNGFPVDSVFVLVLEAQGKTSLDQPVMLVEGVNTLTATAVDEAENESAPSNEVRVEFLGDSGVFIPAPFRSGDQIYVNLSAVASRVTLRIYDLSGDLVVVLTDETPARNYAIEWNGRNGDGEQVKKGPLVAVAQAEYDAGTDVVLRELFLYDPNER